MKILRKKKKFRDKYQYIERLFEEYCFVLIKELISDNIILPIKGKYDVKYYLDHFYSFLKDAIEDLLFVLNEDSDQDDVPFILWDYIWRVRKQTIRMYELIISNAWESLDVCDLFSGLLGRKISTVNDFIEVDKIICDYINMMRSVKGKEKYEINFINPMIIENFECQLIRGIEIIFENLFELGEIKAYNSERDEIKLLKTVDYFENKNNNGICLTYEMIFERKIHEIEIISKSGDFKECFVVKDDFTIKNKELLLN